MLIPGAQTLDQQIQTVEFIQAVAKADGLADALKQLRDERATIENLRAEVQQKQNNAADLLAQADKRKAEADAAAEAADIKTREAEVNAASAQKRLYDAIEAEESLEDARDAFASEKAETEKQIAASISAVQEREKAAAEALAEGEALKAEYGEKLAKLRETVS